MGNCCCQGDDDDEKLKPLLTKEQGYIEMAPIKFSKEVKLLVKGMRNILGAILPDMQRLFPGMTDEEESMELIGVIDRAIQRQDTTLNLKQRHEIINRSTPAEFSAFRNALHEHLKQEEEKASKPQEEGRRRSGTVLRKLSAQCRSELPRMLQLWFEADIDCSGSLSESEIKTLLAKMNITMSSASIKKLVAQIDTDNNGQLEFFEFIVLWESLTTIAEILPIFQRYAKQNVQTAASKSVSSGKSQSIINADQTKGVIVEEDLIRFLVEFQKTKPDDLQDVRKSFGEMKVIEGMLGISFRQFQAVLIDQMSNSWMHPRELKIHQDMTQPYTHYFQDCSHNTYLTGHQLHGASSCDMYRRTLLNGCRCVELDCWDGPENDPKVTHGMTLATNIRFYDVCVAINETAFKNSPFPVMLSLEIHTSPAQQEVQVKMMKEVFGSKMTNAAMAEASQLSGFEFSPEGLKYKILVKAKRLKGKSSMKEFDSKDDDEEDENAKGQQQVPKKDTGAHAVSQALSDVTYIASTKFSTTAEMLKKPHYEVSSIDELKIEKWSKGNVQEYVDLSKQFLLRVYPKGLRCDSSNFSPQLSWNLGAQLVAMNIQTSDEGMRLNRSFFKRNGQCGMILKPLCMRAPGVKRSWKGSHILTVKIICGVQLPKPGNSKSGEVIDPYVEVFVNGIDTDDTSAHPRPTKVIDDNGFNPTWNESFTFTVNALEMASLTIRVMEKDPLSSEFIGDNTLALTSLREGIRCVPLYINGDFPMPSPTGVLCQFTWQKKDEDSFLEVDGRTLRSTTVVEPPHETSKDVEEVLDDL